MTGDELAAWLYAEQGYLVYGSIAPLTRGEIVPVAQHRQIHGSPLRVIGPSRYEELRSQVYLADRMTGIQTTRFDRWPYYYRTEAAD